MTIDVRKAFSILRFDWRRGPQDVWRTSPVNIDGFHLRAKSAIQAAIDDAEKSTDSSPTGVLVQGQRGSGKTHLLGWVRERVHERGGYFFLVGPLGGTEFWPAVVSAVREDLQREVPGKGTQLVAFLQRLATIAQVPAPVVAAICGKTPINPKVLDTFVHAVQRVAWKVGNDCQDVLRALVLYASHEPSLRLIGDGYVQSFEELKRGERARWGIRANKRHHRDIVTDTTRLLALSGFSVIAFDQIDSVSAEFEALTDTRAPERQPDSDLDRVADGLIVLIDTTARTLCLVSCLPTTWIRLRENAIATFQDRFRVEGVLGNLETPALAEALVARRVADQLAKVSITPPYPTWPVSRLAFADATKYTPRDLLRRIEEHVNACVNRDEFRELVRLDAVGVGDGPLIEDGSASERGSDLEDDFKLLDIAFDRLLSEADVRSALDPDTEDTAMPSLLSAGLEAWIEELGEVGEAFDKDPLPGTNPALHARLIRSLDDARGDQMHWAFRAIASTTPLAALHRLRGACTRAGIDHPGNRRRLVILRAADWSKGATTQQVVKAFKEAGGVRVVPKEDDLRVFYALRELLAKPLPNLRIWLRDRKHASRTALFSLTLADATRPFKGSAKDSDALSANEASKSVISLGVDEVSQMQVSIDLEVLRRHIAIFAGSGSGKTVLIRRIIEECALRGVSSIVLDPNNDLARLGDAWPEAPADWGSGDAELANEYLANTDVVIWTPRRASGRPLTFQPLPDFRSVVDDEDEFNLAIDAAVATLAEKASAISNTDKARIARAVLREALVYYAKSNGSGLTGFLDLLAELPDGVTSLDSSGKIASGLTRTLRAAVINDPLFGGHGEAVDPGVLLTPRHGKRARVSVISMIGLPNNDQRQSFVNQLQMALFAWVKKNPAGDRPLGGLFVMDEAQNFAPSSGSTACTESTLALAAQARKYGLGLVFATQQPKGLHNHIPGNSATQFFGLLNAPVQMATAQEMAKLKGGSAPDIGRLGVGEFYVASDKLPFRKIETPLCLSYHGKSPLTEEEIIKRARGSRE